MVEPSRSDILKVSSKSVFKEQHELNRIHITHSSQSAIDQFFAFGSRIIQYNYHAR